jgi:hypothetical protein
MAIYLDASLEALPSGSVLEGWKGPDSPPTPTQSKCLGSLVIVARTQNNFLPVQLHFPPNKQQSHCGLQNIQVCVCVFTCACTCTLVCVRILCVCVCVCNFPLLVKLQTSCFHVYRHLLHLPH